MTKNKLKTILFASLFVAMILPFSGMQSANASNHPDQVPSPVHPDTDHPTGIPDGSFHEVYTEPSGLHGPEVPVVPYGDDSYGDHSNPDHPNRDHPATDHPTGIPDGSFHEVYTEPEGLHGPEVPVVPIGIPVEPVPIGLPEVPVGVPDRTHMPDVPEGTHGPPVVSELIEIPDEADIPADEDTPVVVGTP